MRLPFLRRLKTEVIYNYLKVSKHNLTHLFTIVWYYNKRRGRQYLLGRQSRVGMTLYNHIYYNGGSYGGQ